MTATATRAITFEEFLALPETEPPSEYIRGEVVEKSGGDPLHAVTLSVVGRLLGKLFATIDELITPER